MRLRSAAFFALSVLTLVFWASWTVAQDAEAVPAVHRGHAIAMHGEPRYGAGFTHFDYLDPDAPKGGRIKLGAQGTFDNFNAFIPKGTAAAGLGYLTDTLMEASADEPFTQYGLIAESLEWPEDRSWVIFTLRPEARWHDGRPITVEDVIWSFETLKDKGQPFYRFYYGSVAKVEKIGDRRVKFSFSESGNRELPLIVSQLPILPKHYWETRDFEKTTLEPPLGSGPYRIADFEAGRFVEYERVEDYWGRDLPVNRGKYNLDRIRFDYFRDDLVVREALKSGDIDQREENQAKAWALDYDVPAIREGWLKKIEIPHQLPTGMQAFVMNTRRPMFADARLRRALAYAFDFEWTNRNLFFSQYTRTESYFSNSELAATGLPEGEELEILERYRGRIPDAVFTTPYSAPATDGSGWPRDNLRRAFELLAEAGWEVRDMWMVNLETGQPLDFEILLVSAAFERIVLPFVRNLERLGIKARVRLVDTSQYINRLRSFDFDMFVGGWGQSESPGNEQRNYWSRAAAESPAARNFAGIKDPAIDELIELVITAPSRESLVARTRALDRVLLAGHYVIPNWHLRKSRLLYWDKFARPDKPTRRGTSLDWWWFDPVKAVVLEERRKAQPETKPAGGGGPDLVTTLAVTLGLILAGFFVFRRVMQRPQA